MERTRSRAKSKLMRGIGGYTIIETMIFLAVSVAFFGTVVTSVTQQSNRNQFTRSVDNLQAELQDVLNDVSTGYYPSNSDFSCTYGPNPVAPPQPQGSNIDCIFIGKTLQFQPTGGADTYKIYSMVGNRKSANSPTSPESANITESKVKLLGVGGGVGISEKKNLLSDLKVVKIVNQSNGDSVGGFAVISDFGKTNTTENTVSGISSRTSLAVIKTTSLGMTDAAFRTQSEIIANVDQATVNGGVIICLQQGDANGRKASLTIGGDNQQLSIDRMIDEWRTECN